MNSSSLEGEIVEARPNSRDVDDDFEHLVAHAMSCTLESGAERSTEYGSLRFGSLDNVMVNDALLGLEEAKDRRLDGGGCRSTHRA